ncbi:MAG: RNA 2',3'-cyclic phosphodiesterase [Myxococcota bacterium]
MRVFFALALPGPAREAVAAVLAGLRDPGVSWTRPENLHITLRFCGEVEDVDALAEAVAPAARRHVLSEVRLVGGGAFPDTRRPRVLWIGVEGALAPLAADLDAAVRAFGLLAERLPFAPHLTVGRVRAGVPRAAAASLAGLGEVARFVPAHVTMYASVLSREGPRYEALREL